MVSRPRPGVWIGKVPLGRAEQLKIEHRSALVEDGIKGQTLTLSNELGLLEKTINLEHLRRVMSLRLEELFQLVEQDIARAGLLDFLRFGRVHLRRRSADTGDCKAGGAGVSTAGVAGPDQGHQRHQIGAGPAGVRDGPSGW